MIFFNCRIPAGNERIESNESDNKRMDKTRKCGVFARPSFWALAINLGETYDYN